jgi:VCBS repeat-containing protein
VIARLFDSAVDWASSSPARGITAAERAGDGQLTSASVLVPDAALLFSGYYQKIGTDLVITVQDQPRFVVPGYFSLSKRPSLETREGAVIGSDVVEVLAGAALQQYAQTEGESGRTAIGRVETVIGTATATRNGAVVFLQVSDRVFKSDLIETGSDSACSITFLDGSAFSLSANCRLVLTELVYTPGHTGNSQLVNLIGGALTFVSGQVAKTGDMKVATPVVTMGIRGTICRGEVSDEGSNVQIFTGATFPHQDGTVGVCELRSTINPSQLLGRATQPGTLIMIRSTGGQFSVSEHAITPTQLQDLLNEASRIEQLAANAFQPNSNGGSGSGTPPLGLPPPEGDRPFTQLLQHNDSLAIPATFLIDLAAGSAAPDTPPVITIENLSFTPEAPNAPSGFTIPGILRVSDPDANDPVGRYVPGSARLLSVVGPPDLPSDIHLRKIVTIDAQTGRISYSRGDFVFLGAGEALVYTFQANVQAGFDSFVKTFTVTFNGLNDTPQITSADARGEVAEGGPSAAATAHEAPPLTGTILFSDPDVADDHRIRWAPAQTGYVGDFSLSDLSKANVGPHGATLTWTYAISDAELAGLDDGIRIQHYLVTIADGHGGLARQTVTIVLRGINSSPVAVNDTFGGDEDAILSGNVLGNDTDVDSAHLKAVLVDGPAHGQLRLNPDGTFTYEPDANYFGVDSFTYRASDGTKDSNLATVLLTVRNVNDAPVAQAGSASGEEDTAIIGSVIVTDLDSMTLTYNVVSRPAHGTVTFNTDGTFTYMPGSDFNGPDSFTYRAHDGLSESNVSTLSIRVTPVNDGFSDGDEAVTTSKHTATSGNVLTNATESPDGPVTVTQFRTGETVYAAGTTATISEVGTLVINGDGSYIFTPVPSHFGPVPVVTYTMTDGLGPAEISTLSITVTPQAVRDEGFVELGDTITFNVAANDRAADGNLDPTSVAIVTGPGTSGTATVNPDGSMTYDHTIVDNPGANDSFDDTFVYRIEDTNGNFDNATVTAHVMDPLRQTQTDAATTANEQNLSLTVATEDRTANTSSFAEVAIKIGAVREVDVNIAFIYDASSSISSAEYAQQILAIQNTVNALRTQFTGAENDVTVKLIGFAGSAQATSNFDLFDPAFNNVAALVITRHAGTNYTAALTLANDFFDAVDPTNSEDNFALFVSDGSPNVGGDFLPEANELKMQASVTAVGFGESVRIGPLNQIDNTAGAQIVANAAALGDVFAASPLFHAKLIDFDLTLSINGSGPIVLADDVTDLTDNGGGSFSLGLASVAGLSGALRDDNVFTATAVFDTDGNLNTHADRITLTTVNNVQGAVPDAFWQ